MRKRFELLPKRRATDPRASAVAFVVQIALIAIIVPAFLVPVALDLIRDDAGERIVPERISFEIALPTDRPTERRPARAGGDNRPISERPPSAAAPLVPPTSIPSMLPTAPAVPSPPGGGAGPIIGGGGPLEGVQPSFTDSRLWVRHNDVVIAPIIPLTRADTLRIRLAERLIAVEDSLAGLPNDAGHRFFQGDWTTRVGGQKVGVDPGFIRLGPVSIPTAALALMPMNVQANPTAMERVQRLASMREDIQRQAYRSMREDEFYAAVRALRARRERERQEREAARQTPPQAP